MPQTTPIRQKLLPHIGRALMCVLALGMVGSLQAQVSSYGDKQVGENRGDELPKVLKVVGVAQHLNGQLPLDAAFVDETGAPVTLGTYFNGKRPAILSLVYFDCPMLCS